MQLMTKDPRSHAARRAPVPRMTRLARNVGSGLAMLTMDHAVMAMDGANQFATDSAGRPYAIGQRLFTSFPTHDGRTADSTGAFLVGELERLDPTLHMPLAAVSWQRDIDLREDVTVADEFSSFTQTTFGSAGGLGAGNGIRSGKAWIGKATGQIGGVGVDTNKSPFPLTPWALEVKYTVLELASAAQMGRPIDAQKIEGLQLKHQMDIDEMVYVGDAQVLINGVAAGGLLNNPLMTNFSNVPNGALGSPLWANKTPDEILADVNALLNSVWAASGYAKMPNKVILPPVQFGLISTRTVSTAGSISILRYLKENNILTAGGGGELAIVPCKWNAGAGAGGTIGTPGAFDRMFAYTQDKNLVRYPMTLLQRTPIQYDSIYHKFSYYCRLGCMELVYAETTGARDGI